MAAQKYLDHADNPKPLPAAALFKAYDEILPEFGISPEADQHLSAFVFRIGGEHGDGSLPEKYQAILSRMGIILEFGDNSTGEASTGTSISNPISQLPPGPSDIAASHPSLDKSSPSDEDTPIHPISNDRSLSHAASPSPYVLRRQNSIPNAFAKRQQKLRLDLRRQSQTQSDISSDDRPFSPLVDRYAQDMGEDLVSNRHPKVNALIYEIRKSIVLSTHRTAVISAIDAWRSLTPMRNSSLHRKGNNFDRKKQTGIEANFVEGDHHSTDSYANMVASASAEEVPALNITPKAVAADKSAAGQCLRNLTQLPEPDVSSATNKLSSGGDIGSASLQFDRRLPENHQLGNGDTSLIRMPNLPILHRASRAREIFLASKVFNRWIERIAARHEREAVARRHMIRFRCFRGWIRAPDSVHIVIHNLRAAIAIQTVTRAVKHQERQIRTASIACYEDHQLQSVRTVFERWRYRLREQAFLRKTFEQTRNESVFHWVARVWIESELREAAKTHSACLKQHNFRRKCFYEAQRGHARFLTAQQAGNSRLVLTSLQTWTRQVDTRRLAIACRKYHTVQQASLAFCTWNLRARAQAFRWKLDYMFAQKGLEMWARSCGHYNYPKGVAERFVASTYKDDFRKRVKNLHYYDSTLKRLCLRAGLYISAFRLLQVFATTVNQRKNQDRWAVRQYLMQRYTEVSSSRKRRLFFASLDGWRTTTVKASLLAQTTGELTLSRSLGRRLQAQLRWRAQAFKSQLLQQDTAREISGRAWVRLCDTFLIQQKLQFAQAWILWAACAQHQCLKKWLIGSLQMSGHAHMAAMVRQRHSREGRGRTFRQWRQRSSLEKKDDIGINIHEPPGSDLLVQSDFGSIPKSLPSSWMRRRHASQADLGSPVDTPTRWTGQRAPLAGATTPMLVAKLSTPQTAVSAHVAHDLSTQNAISLEADQRAKSSSAHVGRQWHPRNRGTVVRASKMISNAADISQLGREPTSHPRSTETTINGTMNWRGSASRITRSTADVSKATSERQGPDFALAITRQPSAKLGV